MFTGWMFIVPLKVKGRYRHSQKSPVGAASISSPPDDA
ncbi:hypothetical protein PshuTeo1_25580 [Pseudomonas hunanensis]|jgi:hypothetical protein|nr:hypothetical protein PshuTeo1_25580 [Pseudomonas hunanensis]